MTQIYYFQILSTIFIFLCIFVYIYIQTKTLLVSFIGKNLFSNDISIQPSYSLKQ